MDKGLVLYPCYFNSSLKRSEGRRVPLLSGVQNPEPVIIERILTRKQVPFRREKKSHPSYWWKGQGRIVADFKGTKGELIRLISNELKNSE